MCTCDYFLYEDINLNGVTTVCADLSNKEQPMDKIVAFLEKMENANNETKRKIAYANFFDKICFRTFLCIDILYTICIFGITRAEFCSINNLDFWN